jgi:hypothetical protein
MLILIKNAYYFIIIVQVIFNFFVLVIFEISQPILMMISRYWLIDHIYHIKFLIRV